MRNPFRGSYPRRTDGRVWSRKAVMLAIADELRDLGPYVSDSKLEFHSDITIEVDFITDNYSSTKDHLQLNASITLMREDVGVWLIDLSTLAQEVFGPKHRALSIEKDREWRTSKIREECAKVYHPAIDILLDSTRRHAFLSGAEVGSGNNLLKLPDGWLASATDDRLGQFVNGRADPT